MIRPARRSLLLAALLAVPAGLGAQETSIKVFSVQNRPAQDLVAALEPLAGPGGSVTSLDDRLIVRATPEALRQIESALAELDVTPRSLWISVRQAGSGSSAAHAAGVAGSVAVAGGGVQVTHEGASVTTRRSQTVVTGAFGAASAESSSDVLQRIRALEGRPAFVQRGRVVPVTPTAYAEAGTGFWVLATLSGDLVSLELATAEQALGPDATLDQRRLRTSLTTRPGEWVHVGGLTGESAFGSGEIAGRAAARATEGWDVELLVELAPDP